MSKFKEEHILIVAPGSQTTLAQLGLQDSIVPAKLRVPTRIFKAEKDGEYEPYKVRSKTARAQPPPPPAASATDGDQATTGEGGEGTNVEPVQEETAWEEDVEDDEGAILPIQMGRIVDMPALLALLTHIDNQLSPPIHSPVMVICDPAWTASDKEQITQFYFQTYSRPAVTMVDSALAVAAAYGVTDSLVIDIGRDKATVTAITDFYPHEIGRQVSLPGLGGMAVNAAMMVERELAIEKGKIAGPKFTYEMAEQLKKQPHICEILPAELPLPQGNPANPSTTDPANAASAGVEGDKGKASATSASALSGLPRGPGAGTQTGTEDVADADGVLDVATIVASGKTNEFLAKKEQEQATKSKPGQKKGSAQEPPKPARIPNSQKATVMFRYQEKMKASELHGANGDSKATSPNDTYVWQSKEIEVGVERFLGCNEDDFLWPLTSSVLDVLESTPVDKRNELASNIIIAGNGSKVKGFRDRILSYLDASVRVSMSNASIFTSELPSNFSTPLATGANTPMPGSSINGRNGGTPTPGPSSSVNPLLLAATTASQQNLGLPGSQPFQSSLQPGTPGPHGSQFTNFQSHHHQQGPTAIRSTTPKDYFTEWKDHGLEEAVFLGGQVMSRVVYSMDSGSQLSYMTRQNFNEEGPTGIHNYTLGC